MIAIVALMALLFGQAQPVKIVNPTNQSKAATTTTSGSKEALDVNCVSGCSGGGGSGGSSSLVWIDGGRSTADEGLGPDGGVWAFYQVNPPSNYVGFDGGPVTAYQGGPWTPERHTVDAVVQFDGGPVTAHVDNFPASQAVTGTFFQATQPVSAAALPLPSGAATEATLSTRTKPSDQQHVIIDSSASLAVTGPATDAQLRATPLPVSGAVTVPINPVVSAYVGFDAGFVSIANAPTVHAVVQFDGGVVTAHVDNFPASQAVTGPLTDAQLRATPVPTSVSSLPLPTGAATETTLGTLLTDGQLRATPVPVSGSVSVYSVSDGGGAVTDAQLRATPVPVTGSIRARLVDAFGRSIGGDVFTALRTDPTGLTSQPINGTVTDVQGQSRDGGTPWSMEISSGSGSAVNSVNIPASTNPVLVGGQDTNGKSEFLKVTAAGNLYVVPQSGQEYLVFQTTISTSGTYVSSSSTLLGSGVVGININVAGAVTGAMAISVQDAASDNTNVGVGQVTQGPVITATGRYTFSVNTKSNAIRLTRTLSAGASMGTVSISLVTHLSGDNSVVVTQGMDEQGTIRAAQVSYAGIPYVIPVSSPPLNPFLLRCNAVRTTGCQP